MSLSILEQRKNSCFARPEPQNQNNMRDKKIFETQVAGKTITVEFTNIVLQAHGSVLVKCGGTQVLATATMSPAVNESISYFPLKVDYEEKFYAAGRILGSRFIRREGRPSDEAMLIGRSIDRTIRPLFDSRMRHDIQVVALTLSLDEENSPDILAILASSLALHVSRIPWAGPVSAVRIGQVGDSKELIVNPTDTERTDAKLDLIVSGAHGKLNMFEGKGKEVPEDEFVAAAEKALEHINALNEFQEKIRKEIGIEKYDPQLEDAPQGMHDMFQKNFWERLKDAVFVTDKDARMHKLSDLKHEWMENTSELYPDTSRGVASDVFEDGIDEIVHHAALKEETRVDGRGFKDVRALYAETKILDRVHGSGLFYRGDTHILSAVTLGGPGDEQLIEGMDVQMKKRFIHHYNFPPFSVGETGRMGSPGRREIGHGALAEKALEAVIPPKELFPYTIRVVSETMSSNGSSSQGSVCASTLALMDAGVPILRPVSGIAMGLIIGETDDDYRVLTDIQGPEDHHGDMDFKLAGTTEGFTAVQMDIKVGGITLPMLKDAVRDAREARLQILEVMLAEIKEPRAELSPYAPRIFQMKVDPEKIGLIIGPGGKTINEIIAETGATIDIEDDGSVFITTNDGEAAEKAEARIKALTKEFKVGDITKGKVVRVTDFGAFVEIAPRQDGLLHVSEIDTKRVEKVTDVLNVGDEVEVQIKGIDEANGKISLSRKALLQKKD